MRNALAANLSESQTPDSDSTLQIMSQSSDGGSSCTTKLSPSSTGGASLIPSYDWFEKMKFDPVTGARVMETLERRLASLDDKGHSGESRRRRRGGTGTQDGRGEDGGGDVRIRYSHIKSHLGAIRAECTQRGIIGGLEGTRDVRFDGWVLFVVTVATAFSEDRLLLCQCASQRLGEEDGLPLAQLNEIVTRMYLTLRAQEKRGSSPGGFINATDVRAEELHDTGFYRLKCDLEGCMLALENFYIQRYASCMNRYFGLSCAPCRVQRALRPDPCGLHLAFDSPLCLFGEHRVGVG